MSKNEIDYYKDYPGKFAENLYGELSWSIVCFVPFLLMSGSAALLCVLVLLGGWSLASGLGLIVSGGLLILITRGFIGSLRGCFAVAIVPYFKEEVGGIDTFLSGQAVAENCRQLDLIALENNVAPISAFGFNDDFRGEEVQWHDPENSLETITTLLGVIRRNPKIVKYAKAIISDLERTEDALRKARSRDIPFCFILRTGSGTNAMEMEQRTGSFF
jgi:hypothetical protein